MLTIQCLHYLQQNTKYTTNNLLMLHFIHYNAMTHVAYNTNTQTTY